MYEYSALCQTARFDTICLRARRRSMLGSSRRVLMMGSLEALFSAFVIYQAEPSYSAARFLVSDFWRHS